jgi:archaellum biogenesis ATPase FlaH
LNFYEFDPDDAKRFGQEQHIKYQQHGDELQFKYCPYCRNKTDDKNTFAINLRTGQFKCLRASCNAKGNMLTLARDFGFSLGRDVDEYYNRTRRFRDFRKYPLPETRDPAVSYMASRGISEAVTKRYHITTRKDADNILVFPFMDDDGNMQFIKYRKTDFDKTKDKNKEWCERNCKPILFGMDQCDPDNDTLIMTEGQIDSLSVAEAGIGNAVSVPTGANGFTWVPYCWDFLGRFKTLIVFGDHERGHITLLDEMRKRFHGVVKHVREEDYRDCKDANELLQKHGKQAIVDAIGNAVIVDNPKIKDLADVERKDLSALEKVKTGFAPLDQKLGGLYFGQLVLLTGERGLGKSTVGSQICIRALDAGYSVFAYSGELNDWMFQDWVDRQCAGPDYINTIMQENKFPVHVVESEIAATIHRWYRGRFYLFDNSAVEGDEDVGLLKIVEEAITQRSCRFIFIDNLMTAIVDDLSSDLYRQQSTFIRALAEMAKRLDVVIMLVVHPRKRNGYQFSNDDIAGSGNISNMADVVLRYARPSEDCSADYDRILQVTKNRLNGKIDIGDSGMGLYFDERSKRIVCSKYDDEGYRFPLGWIVELEDDDGFLALAEGEEMPF